MPEICPSCGKSFPNSSRVLGHMNHPYSPCRWYFMNREKRIGPDPENRPESSQAPLSPITNPLPDSDMDDDHDNQPYPASIESEYFPNAGKTFGSGPNFMSKFDADVHAAERETLPFYPFASKDEFELASWVSRAGLSMKLQDEFFNLKLVRESTHSPSGFVDANGDKQ
jgi:hypothetical protein